MGRRRVSGSPLISRGDVFDVEIPDVGRHPMAVVTRQEAIPVRTNVTGALITSVVRGRPTEVPVNSESGLDHPSVVNCDEIYTVPKRALARKRGSLPLQVLLRVDDALRLSLGLSE